MLYGGGADWLPVWFGGVWSRLDPTAVVVDGTPTVVVVVVGEFRVEFRDMALGRFFCSYCYQELYYFTSY